MKRSRLIRSVFDYKGAPILATGVGLLFLLETRYALRRRKEPRLKRMKTNGIMAATAAVGLRLALLPAIVEASYQAEKNKFGILRLLKMRPRLANGLAFLALDYGNYLWHLLNHRVGWLWRLHQVHHADLDLDVTTALRFHVGEVLASILFRTAWAVGVGASPRVVLGYEIFFEGATNFHHSNLRLPERADKVLANLIVTPRMHGIHHSIVREETDSNYCIIFTVWDRLHRTMRLDIPQGEINVGLPYVRRHLEAWELLKMPVAVTPEWRLPDGTIPQRLGAPA
jgi:sterol desaturase/sphingolipid hydroxylase (fatty acid hydroxylase superfamily)